MARSWDELPRAWLMASLDTARSETLKGFVKEAVQWGFDEPADLTNNGKRVKWLNARREEAWSMVSSGDAVPEPGKLTPEGEKSKKAPRRPRPKTSPRPKATAPATARYEPDDVYPPSRPRLPRQEKRRVVADLCEITAAECNEFLRSLPHK